MKTFVTIISNFVTNIWSRNLVSTNDVAVVEIEIELKKKWILDFQFLLFVTEIKIQIDENRENDQRHKRISLYM